MQFVNICVSCYNISDKDMHSTFIYSLPLDLLYYIISGFAMLYLLYHGFIQDFRFGGGDSTPRGGLGAWHVPLGFFFEN